MITPEQRKKGLEYATGQLESQEVAVSFDTLLGFYIEKFLTGASLTEAEMDIAITEQKIDKLNKEKTDLQSRISLIDEELNNL